MNNLAKKLAAFERLLVIMDELREKCPWDRKQTIHSLRNLTIEETYELAEAITENDWKGVKEELGDLLLHIVFYAKIGEEKKQFDIASVANTLCDKLIARHPHIYGDTKVADEEEVKRNWEKLKLAEGRTSVLSGVPKGLPALIKAMRIQEKAKKIGFDWDTAPEAWEKVEEEMGELQEAITSKDTLQINQEFGDVLFSLVNYARFINVDPENALEQTNRKFIQRFQQMEQLATKQAQPLEEMTLEEMNKLWEKAKIITA